MQILGTICVLLCVATIEARYKEQYRPCSFNPLCTCSNGGPDLGSVCCHNIPFMTIPSQINNSAIYIMSLKHNKLRFLSDNSLNGTGLWKIQINNNFLTDLPPNALGGLEKTLSILDLSQNELVRVPKEAIQNLEKLYNLNLAGNHISFFQNDDFRSLSKTLKVIDLSNNAIIQINNEAFRNMVALESLNLALNAIASLDDSTFQSSMNNLRLINLTGNQLHQIPFNALANLKSLKIVNLNNNLISSISEGREGRKRINLEELHLQDNLIEELTPKSFRLFNGIDRLYFNGNPLRIINDTFSGVNVSEIYFQHCKVSIISKKAFNSLSPTLKVLDLSYNYLTEFPNLSLKKLVKLSIAGNEIPAIELTDIEPFQNSIKYLDIRGPKLKIAQDIFKKLPNLRELIFNRQQSNLNSHSLSNVSPSMEKLSVVRSSVTAMENGAFHQFVGLKQLDLSHNAISNIADGTFKETCHSLEKLILHNALRMSAFPTKVLGQLTKLRYLDVSRNKIEKIQQNSFSTFHNLKHLNLNHNKIDSLYKHFVSGINNPDLIQLKLAFNKLKSLKFQTFKDLQKLLYLQLNDNLIQKIEKSTFFNLDFLISIELQGNLINEIENEAFQNLPNIQLINLAYNKLTTLNLDAFDQVGRLSTLKIDVCYNKIRNLTSNNTSGLVKSSSNIKSIDFSYNNISYIDDNYFDSVRHSISALDLSHNNISDLTNLIFIDMSHLHTLIISHNSITRIEEDEFKGVKDLQMLEMSYNYLDELPRTLFEEQNKLRVFSIARNKLKFLPKDVFSDTMLEQLDLSFNLMNIFPEQSLLEVKDTLQFLDLTGNRIKFLNFSNLKLLENLRHFSIAQNGLHLPHVQEDIQLPQLIYLDISNNDIRDLPQWILESLPKSLEYLNLANNSLKMIPKLDACNILQLNLSNNVIQAIQPGALEQLNKVQVLDFSNNRLPAIHNNLWSDLQQLRSLYLQLNPIQNISNSTFSNMEQLEELYIQSLKIQHIQNDAFHELRTLKIIEMDTFPKLKNTINLAELISKNYVLKEIHLHVQEKELGAILNELIPKSLRKITLEGPNLKKVADSAFTNIQSEDLILDIRKTNVTNLSKKLFQNMREVRNFSALLNDNKLQKVERIFAPYDKEGRTKHLKQLELSGNKLQCSCEIAWIWEWIIEYENLNECHEVPCDDSYLEKFRHVKCVNMDNKNIINAFNTDLDCFSSARSFVFKASLEVIFVIVLTSLCSIILI